MTPSILLVDEDSAATRLLAAELRRRLPELAVHTASSTFRAMHHVDTATPACVVVAHPLAHDSSARCVEKLRADDPALVIVVVTTTASLRQAVRFVRLGADDYVARGSDPATVVEARIRRLLSHARPAESAAAPPLAAAAWPEAASPTRVADLAGLPRGVRRAIGAFASSPLPVLVAGGRRADRARVARALHELGGRADAPFVALRCTALDVARFEREVAGRLHGDDGATAGATLFLDHVDRLAQPLQARLATLLRPASGERFGAPVRGHAMVRVIGATATSLRAGHAPADLRAQLFHRIAVLAIALPTPRATRDVVRPLHDRRRHPSLARGPAARDDASGR